MLRNRLTAAAAKYSKKEFFGKKSFQKNEGWQQQAWSYYFDTPEVRFAANWVGNAMSRSRLFAGKRMPDGSVEPAENTHPAAIAVQNIAGGPSGQSQLLGDMGPHLVVAGEGWIIIDPTEKDQSWRVASVLEISYKNKELKVELGNKTLTISADADDADPKAPQAIRVWDPSPVSYTEADSPVRGSFAILDELRLLNAAVAAIAKSRLIGRGIVFISQGTRFPTKPVQGEAEDDFLDLLMEVAETAYKEPDSAAAAVPIFAEVPPDGMDPTRMTFESEFDELAIRLREEAIRRWATASDTPAEIVLGTGDISHWGQWFTQESAITIGVESRLLTVVDALTTHILRPELRAQRLDDADEWLVWYDTSALRARANKAQTAIEVYDRNGINSDALRRETGFDESDAPTAEETRQRLILEVMRTVPAIAPQLLPLLDIEGISDLNAPIEAEVELPVDETQAEPDTLDQVINEDPTPSEAGFFAACDGVVYRALERAGQKLRSKQPRSERPKLEGIDPAELHTKLAVDQELVEQYGLLVGSWDRVCSIVDRYDGSQDIVGLENLLISYTKNLLISGQVHTYDNLKNFLLNSQWGSR